MTESPELIATVVSASRRFLRVMDDEWRAFDAKSSSKALDATVGDRVRIGSREQDPVALEILPARNCLARSYREETRRIAANLDHLFVVAAVTPLFNTLFIDRVLAVAAHQRIPCSLIVNKTDLSMEDTAALVHVYESLDIPVIYTSAASGTGIEGIEHALATPQLRIVALAGVSGVGKSSLLNLLIPSAESRTGEVSRRTGQGRQTTTQARAYEYPREKMAPLLLVDLPGIQSFGISHLTKTEVADGFVEIAERRGRCEYGDCSHTVEPNCAVQDALESGEIAPTRFESYVRMLAEVEAARKY